MYDRRLPTDVLRNIHAAVEPPPPSAYPEAVGLLPAGSQVILGCLQGQAELNGERGVLLGTDAASGQYQVKMASGQFVQMMPENVMPQSHQAEAPVPNEGCELSRTLELSDTENADEDDDEDDDDEDEDEDEDEDDDSDDNDDDDDDE